MGQIQFNIIDGGIGRPITGKDHYSGLLFSNASLPAGITATTREQKIFSLSQAEDLGITQALFPAEHYHISEAFRINSSLVLWVGWYAAYTGVELTLLQKFSNGQIRQTGIYSPDAFTSTMVGLVDTEIEALRVDKIGMSAILVADFTGFTLATLPDLRALDKKNVTVSIGEDLSGVGGALADTLTRSVGTVGNSLGLLSLLSVHENQGWKTNDVSGAIELQDLRFATGESIDQAEAQYTTLDTYGYQYLEKRPGGTEVSYNDGFTCAAATSDFIDSNSVRTMDKAIRLIYERTYNLINSPISVNATTGLLSNLTIATFETPVFAALNQMAQDSEISVDEDSGKVPANSVIIDPTQNVLSTSKIEIQVQIVPQGVARLIVFNIGYTTQIT